MLASSIFLSNEDKGCLLAGAISSITEIYLSFKFPVIRLTVEESGKTSTGKYPSLGIEPGHATRDAFDTK